MEKFVFMAGIKDVVEVAKIKEHSFMNRRDEIVEELPVYMDGKSLTWRYRLNYPNSREEGAYQEGITVDFKDMGKTTENKQDFTNTMNIIVREPWFQGRLQEIRADAAWLEMDRDYEPSKMRNTVIERFIEDLNDITRRLNGVRRGFVERQKSVADLSVDSKPKVKDNVIKM